MFAGSLVALITPMRADGSIDFDAWKRLLDLHLRSGTAGVIIGGTTGESVSLLESEMRALIEHAISHCAGRLQIIAGAGQSSTAASIERVRALSKLALDALLVVTPAYIRPPQQGLYEHFRAIAAVSSVPVILYNVPSRTAVDLLPETVARLAQLPQIRGIKEAVPDLGRLREHLARCPKDFAVLSGEDKTACEWVLAGAHGVISVTANIAPRLFSDMIAAARRGDRAAATAIDAKLKALNCDLFLEVNPIPAKWALQELGMIEGGIRLPLTPLSVEYQDRVRAAMRAAGVGQAGSHGS